MTFTLLAVVLVGGLAAYRLTRIVTRDSITDPARAVLYDWAWSHPGGDRKAEPVSRGALRSYVYELLTCSYCFGVWVSLLVTLIAAGAPWSSWHGGRWLLVFAAIAGVQSFVSSRPNA